MLEIYRVRREKLYTPTKHLFSDSVKFFSTHPVQITQSSVNFTFDEIAKVLRCEFLPILLLFT